MGSEMCIRDSSDITTTRRIYTHIRERQLENAAAQIENYIQTTSK